MTERKGAFSADVLLVHTSDLHISGHRDLATGLDPVIDVAIKAGASAVLLAGDIFDSNRVPEDVLLAARARLESIDAPVVILPGNHDSLSPGSCYDRVFHGSAAVTVLGMTTDELHIPHADVQVWGVPHIGDATTYSVPRPPPRTSAWQVALLHGHYTESPVERYSWAIRHADLERTGADYIALGHWDHRAHIADVPPAWYSGSPHHAGSVNVVGLSMRDGVQVVPVRTDGGVIPDTAGRSGWSR